MCNAKPAFSVVLTGHFRFEQTALKSVSVSGLLSDGGISGCFPCLLSALCALLLFLLVRTHPFTHDLRALSFGLIALRAKINNTMSYSICGRTSKPPDRA